MQAAHLVDQQGGKVMSITEPVCVQAIWSSSLVSGSTMPLTAPSALCPGQQPAPPISPRSAHRGWRVSRLLAEERPQHLLLFASDQNVHSWAVHPRRGLGSPVSRFALAGAKAGKSHPQTSVNTCQLFLECRMACVMGSPRSARSISQNGAHSGRPPLDM